jgi:dTDP-4-dehydrorhamnose reductase
MQDAWDTNATGTQNIAELTKKYGAGLAYISTAGVFDGEKELYTEEDRPNPVNEYGRSKFKGEELVSEICPDAYIFRAGWMMGGGPRKDKKFINKIFRQIQSGNKEIFGVTDKTGAPTYTVDFAASMFRVMENLRPGLYHQVCLGNCTRYEVAGAFVEALGLDDLVKVTPVGSEYFMDEYFTLRPDSESLLNYRLDLAGFNKMRPWKECLQEYSLLYKNILEGAHAGI